MAFMTDFSCSLRSAHHWSTICAGLQDTYPKVVHVCLWGVGGLFAGGLENVVDVEVVGLLFGVRLWLTEIEGTMARGIQKHCKAEIENHTSMGLSQAEAHVLEADRQAALLPVNPVQLE